MAYCRFLWGRFLHSCLGTTVSATCTRGQPAKGAGQCGWGGMVGGTVTQLVLPAVLVLAESFQVCLKGRHVVLLRTNLESECQLNKPGLIKLVAGGGEHLLVSGRKTEIG
jgi:hypothetical protein